MPTQITQAFTTAKDKAELQDSRVIGDRRFTALVEKSDFSTISAVCYFVEPVDIVTKASMGEPVAVRSEDFVAMMALAAHE